MASSPTKLDEFGRITKLPDGTTLTTEAALNQILHNQTIILTVLSRLLEEQGLMLAVVIEESEALKKGKNRHD